MNRQNIETAIFFNGIEGNQSQTVFTVQCSTVVLLCQTGFFLLVLGLTWREIKLVYMKSIFYTIKKKRERYRQLRYIPLPFSSYYDYFIYKSGIIKVRTSIFDTQKK